VRSFNLYILCFLSCVNIIAAQDSLKLKTPKHYFNTCFYFNSYRRLESNIIKPLNTPITYKYRQINTGFYSPLYTRDWYNSETEENSNLHLLLTGNLLIAVPQINYVAKFSPFHKISIGVRAIYNQKNKNVWFGDITPFSARDRNSRNNGQLRISGVLLYSRIINDKLSFKFGIYKSYLFGNNRYLPIIGFRIGSLDRVNFQFQFPRNISFNFPVTDKVQASFYLKSIGGQYTYRRNNYNDSLNIAPPTMVFSRFETLSGALINFNINQGFTFFLSSGFSAGSVIGFGQPRRDYEANGRPFRAFKLSPALYLNAGLSFTFGRTKRLYNNTGIYESYELNKSFDPGDNNMGPSNNQIPSSPKVSKVSNNLGYEDVKDFIKADDLY
jgi:hypothetical protein